MNTWQNVIKTFRTNVRDKKTAGWIFFPSCSKFSGRGVVLRRNGLILCINCPDCGNVNTRSTKRRYHCPQKKQCLILDNAQKNPWTPKCTNSEEYQYYSVQTLDFGQRLCKNWACEFYESLEIGIFLLGSPMNNHLTLFTVQIHVRARWKKLDFSQLWV